MADIFQSLASVLRKEAKIQKEIINVLADERAVVSKLKNVEIEKITEIKNHVISQAKVLELERMAIVKSFNLRPKQGNTNVKLDDIIELCENESTRDELLSAKSELKELATAAHKLNEENASVIHDTLGVVASTVAIMLSSHDESVPTYERSGEMKQEKKATKLNSTLRASV